MQVGMSSRSDWMEFTARYENTEEQSIITLTELWADAMEAEREKGVMVTESAMRCKLDVMPDVRNDTFTQCLDILLSYWEFADELKKWYETKIVVDAGNGIRHHPSVVVLRVKSKPSPRRNRPRVIPRSELMAEHLRQREIEKQGTLIECEQQFGGDWDQYEEENQSPVEPSPSPAVDGSPDDEQPSPDVIV